MQCYNTVALQEKLYVNEIHVSLKNAKKMMNAIYDSVLNTHLCQF